MNHWAPARACFVTGTDTEVGKTRVSAALLHWFASQGLRSAGLKPVAAGTDCVDGHPVNEDVKLLQAASSLALEQTEICPFQFDTACAPHVAAQVEGRSIDRGRLLDAVKAVAPRADALVVVGVGGFCVPLGPDWDSADLAQDLDLPVILVVGLRLGCISHALLTAQAVQARGLRLLGWVGNAVDPHMAWRDDTIAYLREHLRERYDAPCLGCVPWLPSPDAAAVGSHLDAVALHSVFPPCRKDHP